MAIFLAVLSAMLFLVAVHPFITYPLSLRVIRRFGTPAGRQESDAAEPISFAVCMCAYNEERVIEEKMRNLLALREREPGLEILVYVDAASDRTAEILGRYADSIDLHVSAERHGKTYGMNLLVSRARASVIVFTDANVMLDLEALDKLRPYFAERQIGCVCGNLIYTNADESLTAASGSLYWRLEQSIKKLEQETGSIMGADGSLFAIRHSLHRSPPDHIIDDMYVSFMILCEGYRIVQADDVRAFEASVTSSQEEFKRKVRIACQAFNVHRLLWPRLKQLDGLTLYKYVSHKLIRWLTIYSLALALLCGLAALLAAGQWPLALGATLTLALGLALGLIWEIKPFSQVTDILLAFAGAGLGVWRSLRGERFQTWTPAASIRKS
ncbi:MAG: Histidine kinase [Rhodocyclales bacterium]|nr:Histidine kinase [Rhodocyclales bacterium]